MNQLPPILLVALAAAAFLLEWIVILHVIARWAGWTTLSRAYPARKPVEEHRWHCQHAKFRWGCKYSGALTVGASSQGLSIRIFPLFRFGHPPLFFPWDDVRIERRRSFWTGETLELTFQQTPGVTIRFARSLAERIAAAIGPELIAKRTAQYPTSVANLIEPRR